MQDIDSREHARQVAIDHHHDVAAVFEAFYAQRDRFANAFTYGRYKIDVRLDAELKKLRPGAAVLDVGCGTGEYVKRLTDLGFQVSGLEPAPAMRASAEARNPSATIVDGVVTALPFASESFDLVIAMEVLRYLDRADVVAGTREIVRVLKPGGVAFITYVNRYALDGFWLWQRMRQVVRRKEFDRRNPHCEFTTPREVREDFAAAGVTDVAVEGRLFAPLRFPYRVRDTLGASIARVAEPFDDLLCERPWTVPFAGHLIGIARKP
jgi:SAM-dependent methyltransferase